MLKEMLKRLPPSTFRSNIPTFSIHFSIQHSALSIANAYRHRRAAGRPCAAVGSPTRRSRGSRRSALAGRCAQPDDPRPTRGSWPRQPGTISISTLTSIRQTRGADRPRARGPGAPRARTAQQSHRPSARDQRPDRQVPRRLDLRQARRRQSNRRRAEGAAARNDPPLGPPERCRQQRVKAVEKAR